MECLPDSVFLLNLSPKTLFFQAKYVKHKVELKIRRPLNFRKNSCFYGIKANHRQLWDAKLPVLELFRDRGAAGCDKHK